MIKDRDPINSSSNIYADIYQIREAEYLNLYKINNIEYESAQEALETNNINNSSIYI